MRSYLEKQVPLVLRVRGFHVAHQVQEDPGGKTIILSFRAHNQECAGNRAVYFFINFPHKNINF